ncbi:MAG: helix-turn-helix domain-containing protein [Henriciella sp.]
MGSKEGYVCPVTQYLLADTLGLSAVHVNRVLRQLRESGLVTFGDGHVTFHDYGGLVELAEFDPAYLDQTGPLLA